MAKQRSNPVQTKPNVLVIMGDDIGWFNIGAYHRGIMAGRTPQIDKLASEGTLLTDYYAEASCTAGRAAFITGELPIRTGLTTVGQAGATVGMPDQAPTIATALRELGYATGQFGKNHLGDRNEYLPTLHGFDEFYGYLYHLDAMEDPFWHSYPPELKDTVGPRDVIHTWASDVDDPTVDPRWGRVGKQKIETVGPLPPHPVEGIKLNMETVDDEILAHATAFIDGAKAAGKPFFTWLNTTRMHVLTHLSEKYRKMQTPENGWYTYEAGMAQFDDIVGGVLKHLEDAGLADDTLVVLTTDNGAEVIGWPDGGQTPFRGEKGMSTEGGFRAPCIVRWPGKIPAGTVNNGMMASLDWFPTILSAAGDPGIVNELLAGKQLGDRTYKVHLDGYDQLPLLTGKGPSARNEFFYFDEANLGAVRIGDYKYVFIDQPEGWFGPKEHANWPQIYNLRLDPFERSGPQTSPPSLMNFFAHEFWRFVYVQQEVAKLAASAIDFPPMQKPASFNLEAVKAQVDAHMTSHVSA
ncbi:MAG TPA: arylsulfatase [Candidatus Limnocylindria bacterium]|jgi:arylsulfatase A-like enzyme|nr:arylsulfatase [Candidatus Limnocylindria bacterium]